MTTVRLSTNMMFQQTMGGIMDGQSRWSETAEQLATGKRINRPSDDPMGASQAIQVVQAEAQNAQYKTARVFANQSMGLEESVTSNVTSAIQSALTSIVYAGNGTLSDQDRGSIAADLQGIKDRLVNLANTTDGNGRYIFGGYESDSPPFSTNSTTGVVSYTGGTQPVEAQVDAARSITVRHTGQQVFLSLTANPKPEPIDPGTGRPAASVADMFKTLDIAINSLKQSPTDPDLQKNLDKANRGLHNSLNNVLSVRGELGTQMNEMDTLDDIADDRSLVNNTQLSNLQDADWTSAISTYTLQKVALEGAYKTFTDLQSMSLFQLNR